MADSREPPPFGFRFIAPLALGSTLNPINSTMLSTALMPIADSLGIGAARAGWLIAGLYLTTAVAQPAMGRLVDLCGPRRVYLVSVLFVALAGIWGGCTSSLTGLVLVRVLLGLGTSGAYPAAMRIFRLRADRIGAKPPRAAMGVLSLAAISTMSVGPLIGGVLTGAFGWHSIFLVNVPLALLTAVLIVLWVPRDPPRTKGFARLLEEVDLAGVGLFAAFLLSLMTFLMNLDRPLWLALLGSAVLGAIFAGYSMRRRRPFINVRMLARNGPLVVTYLRACAVQLVVYCVFYGFAQWLESARGLSSARAGLVTVPMSLVAAISSVTGVRTKGLRGPFLVSIGAALAGCAALWFVGSGSPIWGTALAVVFFGIPQGTFSTATQAAVYIQAPAEEMGMAAGLQRTAQYIGAIAAASLLGLMYGQRASDGGLHHLATVMGALTVFLFVVTLFDRTIPAVKAVAPARADEPVPTSTES